MSNTIKVFCSDSCGIRFDWREETSDTGEPYLTGSVVPGTERRGETLEESAAINRVVKAALPNQATGNTYVAHLIFNIGGEAAVQGKRITQSIPVYAADKVSAILIDEGLLLAKTRGLLIDSNTILLLS